MGTINRYEREELRNAMRIPKAGRYIEFYLEQLDKHREIVSDVILENE